MWLGDLWKTSLGFPEPEGKIINPQCQNKRSKSKQADIDKIIRSDWEIFKNVKNIRHSIVMNVKFVLETKEQIYHMKRWKPKRGSNIVSLKYIEVKINLKFLASRYIQTVEK